MPRIGVISDTHGLVRPQALRALAGADLIVHAGDVGGPAVLEALRGSADVESVSIAPAPEVGSAPAARGRHIRVDQVRLDAMMKQVGELTVARNRLVELAHGGDPALVDLSARISRLVSDLQAEVLASRMTPVDEAFERFPRLVRDLARELGMRIRLDLEGEEIELDRAVLDELVEPLMHLVRNAADHGIESPDDRTAAGKAPEGRLLISAARERRTVTIRVTDDGRGIDPALIGQIFNPGFSTAAEISELSGRGVGLDVVKTGIEEAGGSVSVRSQVGHGSTFEIKLPSSR